MVFKCLAVFLGLFLSSCYLVSDERIGGDAAIFDDPHLPGLWKVPGEKKYFLILKTNADELGFHFFEGEFRGDSESYFGKATKIGEHTFLNVQRMAWVGGSKPAPGYIPVSYTASATTLSISLFDTEFFDAAIKAQKLAGVPGVKKQYSTSETRLTGKGIEVGKYIVANLANPAILEKKRTVFERVRLE